MTRLYLTSPANQDYSDTVAWYERKQCGLGQIFESELSKLFDRIQKHPEQFPEFVPTVRRGILPKFHHKIYFTVSGDQIAVLAIYHPSRNPVGLRKRF